MHAGGKANERGETFGISELVPVNFLVILVLVLTIPSELCQAMSSWSVPSLQRDDLKRD